MFSPVACGTFTGRRASLPEGGCSYRCHPLGVTVLLFMVEGQGRAQVATPHQCGLSPRCGPWLFDVDTRAELGAVPHACARVLGVLQIVPVVTELVGSSYRYHRGEVGSWAPVLVTEPVAHLPGRAAPVPWWAVAPDRCGHDRKPGRREGGGPMACAWWGAGQGRLCLIPCPSSCLCRMQSTASW